MNRYKYNSQVYSGYGNLKNIFSVVFSRELRIPSSICKNGESILYSLNAVVVHCGKEINRGHYITLVRPSKYHDTWLCFDDEDGKIQFSFMVFQSFFSVDILTASDLDTFFGTTESSIGRGNTESGYILFYQKVDEEKEKEQNETTNHVSTKSQKEKKK